MKTELPNDAPTPRLAAWCDRTVEVLVATLLAVMPFALGVVAPWSEAAVMAVITVIATCLVVRAWVLPSGQNGWSWAFLPVGMFVAIAAAQLATLPAGVVGALSPHTAAIKTQLLGDLPDAAAVLARMTLTFYPAATRHDLRIVLACTVMFVASLQVFRREEQYKRILWTVAISGGCAALLALLQDYSGTDKIYWTLPSGRPLASAGPFVGYSNFSQHMNLCIGASLGLVLLALRRNPAADAARRARRGERGLDDLAASRPSVSGWQWHALKSWTTWPLLAIIAIGCVSLFLSLSRGGMLALLCASAFTVLMLARRRGTRNAAWLFMLLLLAAFVGLLYAGFDAAFDRLATLKTAHDPSAGRLQMFRDILVAWRKFPLFGTGLGTHEYVYPMFDRSSDPNVAEFADGDYFQMLEEVGAVGVALVLAFASFVWLAYARAVRSGRGRLGVLAYGLGFGLLAVMLQSWADFGQHLPAIGCLSAVFCGMLMNLGRPGRRGKSHSGGKRHSARTDPVAAAAELPVLPGEGRITPTALAGVGWRLAMPAALVVAMGWACSGAGATWRAQAASDRATAIAERLESADWRVGTADFNSLLREATAAVAADPSEVKARYLLATYHWRSIATRADAHIDTESETDVGADAGAQPPAEVVVDGAAGAAAEIAGLDDDAAPAIGPRAKPDSDSTHHQDRPRPAGPSASPSMVAEAGAVIDELNATRRVCPTFGPAYAVAGQIEQLVLNSPVGSAHVRTAFSLAPANPEVCFAAAQLDVAQGRYDDSLKKARRCLVLDGDLLAEVTDLYLVKARRPDLLVAAVADDAGRLFQVYDRLREESENPEAPDVSAATATAAGLLKTAGARPEAPSWMLVSLAGLYGDEGDRTRAIECYRRALKKDYGEANYHFGLATLLADQGDRDEAVHQAEVCLHLKPQMQAARQLIQELNTRPSGPVVPLPSSASIELFPSAEPFGPAAPVRGE